MNTKNLVILMAIMICLPISFANAQQMIGYKSLSASLQSQLPVNTESYSPAGNTFDYKFTFHNSTANPTMMATIHPKVVSSNLNLVVASIYYSPGDHTLTGTSTTGAGQDYLKIDVSGTSYPNIFSNMTFEVSYYNTQQQ